MKFIGAFLLTLWFAASHAETILGIDAGFTHSACTGPGLKDAITTLLVKAEILPRDAEPEDVDYDDRRKKLRGLQTRSDMAICRACGADRWEPNHCRYWYGFCNSARRLETDSDTRELSDDGWENETFSSLSEKCAEAKKRASGWGESQFEDYGMDEDCNGKSFFCLVIEE